MKTATIENVNKMSKYGLKRRPTYDEIANLISENDLITGKLPNRDATFFKSSPEGSYFDGSDSMEQLREEQGRLLLRQMSDILLRQNARTAGRTFHTAKFQQLPSTSPVIAQPSQPMNVDEETTIQTTPTIPSYNTQQASQLNTELEQRRSQAMKRKEETAMNHRGEIFKQAKPTLAEQLLNIQPPRVAPQFIPIAQGDTDDEALQPVPTKSLRKPKKTLYKDKPQSSNEPAIPIINAMDTTSQPKRNDTGGAPNKRFGDPETTVEPRGKAGRPKRYKEGTDRADGTKREGDEIPEETNRKKSKRTNKNKEKIQKRLEAKMAKETANIQGEEEEKIRKGSKKVRSSIRKQEPQIPSKIHMQEIRNEFESANNKNMITKEEYNKFKEIFDKWMKAKNKKPLHKEGQALYRRNLYNKLKKRYEDDDL